MEYITDTSEPKNVRKFPEGFKFGVATASYQIEGAWDADGKIILLYSTQSLVLEPPTRNQCVMEAADSHRPRYGDIVRADGLTRCWRQGACDSDHYTRFTPRTTLLVFIVRFRCKTPSVWDHMCHQNPSFIVDGTSGDVACNSYRFYERDIEMVKFMNVDFYRFSISWPRILPNGFANHVNSKGVDYYNKIIDRLIELGVEPVATIFHWDLPQNLQDLGGWTNPNVAEWFEDYARVLYENFGDRVKTWITINEPKQICVYGYGMNIMAPAMNIGGIAEYMSIKNMLLAHARAWHLYDREFREKQKGVCGITIATDFRRGASEELDDVEAGLDAIEFEIGLYSHPIFSSKGGFPERVVKRIAKRSKDQGFPRSRLPDLSREEAEFIRGTSDFFGFNHYSTRFYTRKSWMEGKFPVPSYADDLGAEGSYLEDVYNFEKGAMPHTTRVVLCSMVNVSCRSLGGWGSGSLFIA
ncbi:Myrosinase 1 [Eumeta japonica]|uniref:Myrosinase 1 n=1 Tax=Eumeta variegata TaxID=151549 RepID=A0A4C1V190_EUMVA|nr:Myrosinase 1 [Eumeta japonica]